jgi:hypothetical protein
MHTKIRVVIPTIVVNIPEFFDFVRPASAIIVTTDIIPAKKVTIPTILGCVKSPAISFNGYPGVVIIRILVMANIPIFISGLIAVFCLIRFQ